MDKALCTISLAFALIAGCSAGPVTQKPPDYPKSQEAFCNYLGIEASSMPTQQNADTLSLLAVYRFPDPATPPPKEPLAFTSEVNRSRRAETGNQFERAPQLLCPPEHSHAHAPVTPFSATPVVEQ